jgi:hypothetical protein
MDPVILRLPQELLGSLNRGQLTDLIRLLELARASAEEMRTGL